MSDAAVGTIGRVERLIGKRLPASVSEWYSHVDACAILKQYSNDDPPFDLHELGAPLKQWNTGGTRDLVAEELLAIRFENQGVCTWAVRLDGSEDPPVVVTYDAGFREWLRCADTFSDYVLAGVWDHTFVLNGDLLIQARNKRLTDSAIRELQTHFAAGTTTFGWPGHTQYRFDKLHTYSDLFE